MSSHELRLYTVCNKHEMKKIGKQTLENRKYYLKCSNNFSADCNWPHIRNLQLSDPNFDVTGEVDLLLGADIFVHLISGVTIYGKTG